MGSIYKSIGYLFLLFYRELFRRDLRYVAGLCFPLLPFLVEIWLGHYEDTSTYYDSTKPDATDDQGPSNTEPMGRIEFFQLLLSRAHRTIFYAPCMSLSW